MGRYDELKNEIDKASGAGGSADEHEDSASGAAGGAAGAGGKREHPFELSEEWVKTFGKPKGPRGPLTVNGRG